MEWPLAKDCLPLRKKRRINYAISTRNFYLSAFNIVCYTTHSSTN